jgi:hypothetical protein
MGGMVGSPFTPGSGSTSFGAGGTAAPGNIRTGSGSSSFGAGATGSPGQFPGQSQALDMIRGILTSPRGAAGTAAGGGQMIGGGIAGVASTLEAEGVMVYNERTKYNEWEFLFDLRKEQAKAASAMGGGMTGVGP